MHEREDMHIMHAYMHILPHPPTSTPHNSSPTVHTQHSQNLPQALLVCYSSYTTKLAAGVFWFLFVTSSLLRQIKNTHSSSLSLLLTALLGKTPFFQIFSSPPRPPRLRFLTGGGGGILCIRFWTKDMCLLHTNISNGSVSALRILYLRWRRWQKR